MNWPKADGSDQLIGPGDMVVGDTGRLYQLAEEQYTAPGDFIRVYKLNRRLYPAEEVSGQHARLVVKIARAVADGHSKEWLCRYYTDLWKHEAVAKEIQAKRRRIQAVREAGLRRRELPSNSTRKLTKE